MIWEGCFYSRANARLFIEEKKWGLKKAYERT